MTFVRDPLSVQYDGPVDAFMTRLTAMPANVIANLPGGVRTAVVEIVSPPGDPGDDRDSDLTMHERAWERAVYHWIKWRPPGTSYKTTNTRGQDLGVSVRIDWGERDGRGVRTATVRLFPYGAPPGGKTYLGNPDLGARFVLEG